MEKHGKYIEVWADFNPKILLMRGNAEQIDDLSEDQLRRLRQMDGNTELIGKKIDGGVVVSDDFARRLDAGETTNSFDDISDMADDVRRAEVSSSNVSRRIEYMGSTPSKTSTTGQEVIDRMRREGEIRDIGGRQFFKSDGKWYPIEEADMSHINDAVTWWNNTGRKYGARSSEVRDFMTKTDNYTLEHFSTNRSRGSILGQTETYLPPLK